MSNRTAIFPLLLCCCLHACRPNQLSPIRKLELQVIQSTKIEKILQSIRIDCDSSIARTLRFRTDTLLQARQRPVHPSSPSRKKKAR